ncbi:hypothetical protein D3C84_559860 [compost metagenome]
MREQPQFEGVRQQFAIGIAYALTVDPLTALHRAIGQHQGAMPLITVIVELADVKTAVGQVQAALPSEAPVAEVADIVAVVSADQLALAIEGAFLELADPDIAVGVFVATLAM